MQPGPPSEHPPQQYPPQQYPPQQAAGWPPVPGRPGPDDAPQTQAAGPTVPVRRNRPGLIVLVTLLVEIIAIGAADNQWVAQRLSDNALNHPSSIGHDFALSALTYQWRFTPSKNDQLHLLWAQFALIGVVLLGSVLLVLAAARRGASFGRVFLGTWTAVIALSGLGAVVRGLVVDGRMLGGESRLQFALFSSIGPTQYVFVGSAALGLLAGLAAGITATIGKSDEPMTSAAAVPAAGSGPAYAGPPQQDPRAADRRVPDTEATQQFEQTRPREDAPTEQFEATRSDTPVEATRSDTPVEAPAEQTRQLPVVDEDPPPRTS